MIDDAPFKLHGLAGAFAYGVMNRWDAVERYAGDDGARAAWSVCAPIGIECRTALPPSRRPPYEAPPSVDPRVLASEAVRSFERCLSPSDARTWAREVELVRSQLYAPRPLVDIAEMAYYGFCDRNDGVQTLLRIDRDVGGASMQSEFGFMLWDFGPFRGPPGWYSAVGIGSFAMTLPRVMGRERGWAEIERLAACSRKS